MSDILYSQKEGFVDYNVPEELQVRADEKWDDWEKRIGLKEVFSQNSGEARRLSERHSDIWSEVPGSCKINVHGLKDPKYPQYLVYVCESYDRLLSVWVKTDADLLALRIQLAQLHSVEIASRLGDLYLIAKRGFHALHGHDADDACNDCDPKERREELEAQQAARERAAKERISFILNPKEGRVAIFHAATQEIAEGYFAKHAAKKPGIILAVCKQGTRKEALKLYDRFQKYALKGNGGLYGASEEILSYINTERKSKGQGPVALSAPEEAN